MQRGLERCKKKTGNRLRGNSVKIYAKYHILFPVNAAGLTAGWTSVVEHLRKWGTIDGNGIS